MAFYERTDERDKLIVCNICNVNCSERSMTSHRMKCSVRHADKFKTGELIRCSLDSGHIIKKGEMDDHLEFCLKNQNNLVAEFQRDTRLVDTCSSKSEDDVLPTPALIGGLKDFSDPGDDWNKEADQNPFIFKFSKLRIDQDSSKRPNHK